MTLSKSIEKTITACSCGSPFQGERFKKHIQSMKGHDSPHTMRKRVWFCVPCGERVEGERGEFGHAACMYVQLSKSQMQFVLDGDELTNRQELLEEARKKAEERKIERRKKAEEKAEKRKAEGEKEAGETIDEEERRRREETERAVASIAPQEQLTNALEELAVPLRRRVRQLSDSSSESDFEAPAATSSPKAGLPRQAPYNPRKVSEHPSQAKAIESLTSRLAATAATLKEVREDRDKNLMRRELVQRWEVRMSEMTAEMSVMKKEKERLEREAETRKEEEKRRWMEQERRMTELMERLAEKEKALVEKEKAMEEMKEAKEMERRKMEEESRALLKAAVKAAKRKEWDRIKKPQAFLGHLACHNGRIVRKRLEREDDLDATIDSTSVCFHEPSRGVHCHHVTMRVEADTLNFAVRNLQTESVGKKSL